MNIINFLKKNKDARRIFGERELVIIEKQVLGVSLSQSEKNRLSRDIRKKLDFIKELSRFSEDFELKKGSLITEKVERALEVIKNDTLFNKVGQIILFGSTATNKRTLLSDIDIAVKFLDIDEKEALKFRLRILGNFEKDMDIQVYNSLPNKIKKEIDKEGRVIYDKNR